MQVLKGIEYQVTLCYCICLLIQSSLICIVVLGILPSQLVIMSTRPNYIQMVCVCVCVQIKLELKVL